jgi:LacI family transcriptional regulator
VLCANDHIAGELLKLAANLGVRVPSEISVLGFDDHPGASLTNPPLTSLGQPLNEMGRMSLRRLVALINEQPVEPLHLKVPGTLVIRESTGPPPEA